MHTLKPKTKYRVVTIQFAVPDPGKEELTKYGASGLTSVEDEISETLANLQVDGAFFDDWQYMQMLDKTYLVPSSCPDFRTGKEPYEGEIFGKFFRKRAKNFK